jgi:hypothetical protein
VKKNRVLAIQNALSENIFHVRENARVLPQCKKWPSGKERILPEKGVFCPENCRKYPQNGRKFAGFRL